MNIIKIFETIRNIPYKIPLSLEEEDFCCAGKHIQLKELLEKAGFKARYRICAFYWDSMDIPEDILSIKHDNYATHLFLEVFIEEKWIKLDASWDESLKNIFKINYWDGISDTEIAVKVLELFSPEKSLEIMNNNDEKEILADLKINGDFYKVFNEYLEESRK